MYLTLFEASTITGQIIVQLAKLGGLKVVGVADLSKHQQLLQSLGAGKFVQSYYRSYDLHDFQTF